MVSKSGGWVSAACGARGPAIFAHCPPRVEYRPSRTLILRLGSQRVQRGDGDARSSLSLRCVPRSHSFSLYPFCFFFLSLSPVSVRGGGWARVLRTACHGCTVRHVEIVAEGSHVISRAHVCGEAVFF
ncbi:hypothetical protein AMTRI_Chr03g54310 [Amborella trichopoda]